MDDLFDRLKATLAQSYAIEREIGSGGMATVYLAQDLKHFRQVAVKVLRPELAVTLGVERFLREIQIAAGLSHPHILPLYDSGNAEGFLFYVMPYVEGESLRDRLVHEKQLPLDDAVQIAREVADALSYAHGRGVVHRDIKPENILLSGGHAVVADFGIARAISVAGADTLTATGITLGTPAYMSPEQAASSKHIDGRSDLYSLGCVLYEMLGGLPPFTGATAESILHQHRSVEPPAVTNLRPAVPDDVVAVLARVLAKAPADRFSPAAQFAEALARRSTAARLPEAVPKGKRKGRIALIATGVAVVMLAVAGVFNLLDEAPDGPSMVWNRVVVLPFENRTGDSSLVVFGRMAADWITQDLQQTGLLEVAPSAISMDPVDTRAAAKTTGAATVVAGSYYQSGDSLEFQAQVIDARRDQLLRTVDPVTTSLDAFRDGVDTLRQRVVGTLARLFDPRLDAPVATTKPPAIDAYREYLEGHWAFNRAEWREAIPFFHRAVALDSTFVEPRFFLILSHLNLREIALVDSHAQIMARDRSQLTRFQRLRLDWVLALARGDRAAALQSVREIGDRYGHGWSALSVNRPQEVLDALADFNPNPGWYQYWDVLTQAHHLLGDYRRELKEARRGREDYPDVLAVLNGEVRALAALGRLNDVRKRLDQSLNFPPQPGATPGGTLRLAALALRAHGHEEAAREALERAITWYRTTERGSQLPASLALTLYYAGQLDEVRELYHTLAAEDRENVDLLGRLGTTAARQGDRDAAARVGEQLRGFDQPYLFGTHTLYRARIAALLGEREQAVGLLREAFGQGLLYGVWFHRDPDFESLRGYPPFQELLRPKG